MCFGSMRCVNRQKGKKDVSTMRISGTSSFARALARVCAFEREHMFLLITFFFVIYCLQAVSGRGRPCAWGGPTTLAGATSNCLWKRTSAVTLHSKRKTSRCRSLKCSFPSIFNRAERAAVWIAIETIIVPATRFVLGLRSQYCSKRTSERLLGSCFLHYTMAEFLAEHYARVRVLERVRDG